MDIQTANHDMVDQFIAEGALWSAPLIEAFRETPRHWFVKRVYQYHRQSERWQEHIFRDPTDDDIQMIYTDRAWITHIKKDAAGKKIPVSSSSQPSLMAQMLEELDLQPGHRVLEIGAGTGYNAALIAYVVGPGNVVAIDVDLDVVAEAWDHLLQVEDRKITVHQADGRSGFPKSAPYDRIVVTASSLDVETAWIEQMADGGVLSTPLELADGIAYVLRAEKHGDVLRGRLTRPAYFLSLRDEVDFTGKESESDLPDAKHDVNAPWSRWLNQRPGRLKWFPLVQSLAFWGWLHGFKIHHRSDTGGQPAFAIACPDGESWCWFTAHQWQFNNPAARRLADELWQSFLQHGAPWPTEYRLSIALHGRVESEFPVAFRKEGPSSPQLWELTPERHRSAW